MTSRETRTARTRAAIIDAARAMFADRGYRETTMEQIADAVGVGIATLYRYFPRKELMLIEPLAEPGQLARLFEQRPLDEPIEESLGFAALALLENISSVEARIAENSEQLQTPGPLAEFTALQARERSQLELAIASRAGVDPAEVWVVVAARLTSMVTHLAVERAVHYPAPLEQYAREVMAVLKDGLPRAAKAAAG